MRAWEELDGLGTGLAIESEGWGPPLGICSRESGFGGLYGRGGDVEV